MLTAYRCFYISFIVFAIFLSGCGKKIEAGSPEELLSRLKEKGGTSDVMKIYTDDTIDYMRDYMKLTKMSEEAATDVLGFIPADAEYEISEKVITGDNCNLKLRFTKQRVENLNGFTFDIKMIKESGSWKIDKSDDFKKLIKAYEGKGAENYLNSIR